MPLSSPFQPARFFHPARLPFQSGLLFLAVFAVYLISPVKTCFDSRWSIHTSLSFLQGKGGALDDYTQILKENNDFAIEVFDGRPRTFYPIGVSLLAMPFVAAADVAYPLFTGIIRAQAPDLVAPTFQDFIKVKIPGHLEVFVASFYSSVAAALFFLVAVRTTQNRVLSAAAALIFAFCTPMWSSSSRGLWQHGPLVMLYCTVLLLLIHAREKPGLAAWTALPLAFAYITRPTASIVIAAVTLYVLVRHRRQFPLYAALGTAVAIPWMWFNYSVYRQILPPYYLMAAMNPFTRADAGQAWAGLLFSPSRGLFVFSPVFLFSLWGMKLALARGQDRLFHGTLAAVPALHYTAMASFWCWWGGCCYGPRLFADMVPFLSYFLLFALQAMASLRGVRKALVAGFFAVCVAVSFAIHARGAWVWEAYLWHWEPDAFETRLFSWKDAQFLRR